MATQDRLPTSDAYPNECIRYPNSGYHYTKVDDTVGSHDYNSTFLNAFASAAQCEENFGFSAFTLPSGSTDITLTIRAYARSENAIYPGTLQMGILVDGTWDEKSVQSITSTSFMLLDDEWTTNPETSSAWTAEDINGTGSYPLTEMEFYLTAGAHYDSKVGWEYYPARVTQIYLHVEYTPPSGYAIAGGCGIVSGLKVALIG